jgi:hypothetical protein
MEAAAGKLVTERIKREVSNYGKDWGMQPNRYHGHKDECDQHKKRGLQGRQPDSRSKRHELKLTFFPYRVKKQRGTFGL